MNHVLDLYIPIPGVQRIIAEYCMVGEGTVVWWKTDVNQQIRCWTLKPPTWNHPCSGGCDICRPSSLYEYRNRWLRLIGIIFKSTGRSLAPG